MEEKNVSPQKKIEIHKQNSKYILLTNSAQVYVFDHFRFNFDKFSSRDIVSIQIQIPAREINGQTSEQ